MCRRRRQATRQRHGSRPGIRQKEIHLGGGELGRDRQGHDASGDGAEEEQCVIAGIGQTDHQPLARRHAEAQQPAGHPSRRQIESAIGPMLRRLEGRLGIGDDDEGGLLRRLRGRPAEAVACQVELGRRRLAGVAKGSLGGRHLDQAVDELEFRALLIALAELHLALHGIVVARAAGDGQNGLLVVVIGPGDGDLALVEDQRRAALPGFADHHAHAPAIVMAEQLLVALVIDLIGEGQDVADIVVLRADAGDGVGGRAFDHDQRGRRRGARLQRKGRHEQARDDQAATDCQHEVFPYRNDACRTWSSLGAFPATGFRGGRYSAFWPVVSQPGARPWP